MYELAKAYQRYAEIVLSTIILTIIEIAFSNDNSTDGRFFVRNIFVVTMAATFCLFYSFYLERTPEILLAIYIINL